MSYFLRCHTFIRTYDILGQNDHFNIDSRPLVLTLLGNSRNDLMYESKNKPLDMEANGNLQNKQNTLFSRTAVLLHSE